MCGADIGKKDLASALLLRLLHLRLHLVLLRLALLRLLLLHAPIALRPVLTAVALVYRRETLLAEDVSE